MLSGFARCRSQYRIKAYLVLLLLEYAARLESGCRVDRGVALFDVADNPLLVDHERGAIAEALGLIVDAVIFYECAFEIAEQWEGDAYILGETSIGGNAINTDAENLRLCIFEFGDISLIRL